MKRKRILAGLLSCSMVAASLYTVKPVEAIDFSKNESKYMQLCASGNLTNDNKKTCEDFNDYLKDKNEELLESLEKQKDDASKTEETLDSVTKKLEEMNNEITAKEQEIAYVETSIQNTQNEMDKYDQLIKDRMYVMQSYVNDSSIIDYVFSAENFTDFFTRIEAYNDLTANDKDLISTLLESKKAIESQKKTLEDAKKVLEEQKSQQAVLQAEYQELLKQQQQNIIATQNAIYDYGEATESLSAAIDQFNAEAYETPVTGSQPVPPVTTQPSTDSSQNESTPSQTPDSSTSSEDSSESSENNSDSGSSGNESSSSNSGNTSNSGSSTSNSGEVLGYKIYQIAYSKLGCLYYWGASGPSYFDCSGLVYYCLKNAGVSTYRTTAAGYSRMWTAVSWSNSRTGDLVCFGSPAYHIGIVILNADGTRSVIHAGGGNSSTLGNNPNAKVKISSLEPGSYYYNKMTTIRRVK